MRSLLSRSNFYNRFHKVTGLQSSFIEAENFTYRNLIKILEKYINNKKPVLDIGCGVGTIDYFLAKRGYDIEGIDISEQAINICKKNSEILGLKDNIKFKRINFPKEKIRGKYDLIICNEVLEHLKEDKEAVKAIFNLLYSKGIAVFSVPSKNAPLYKMGFADEFDRKVGHLRRYLAKELEDLLKKENFEIKETIRTEGLLRNFLFLNPLFRSLIKILNRIRLLSDLVTFLDNFTIYLFGESDIFVIAQKP